MALTEAFDASFAQVQWIVLAYLLAIMLIVVAGRLGDLLGRRRPCNRTSTFLSAPLNSVRRSMTLAGTPAAFVQPPAGSGAIGNASGHGTSAPSPKLVEEIRPGVGGT